MQFALAICFGMWVCVGNLLTARCDDPTPILIAKGDADGIPKQPQSAIGANGTIQSQR